MIIKFFNLKTLFELTVFALCAANISHLAARERWTPKQANEWYNAQPYRAGVNFIPSYAINSIEFWSKESFDINVIDRELKLASSIGFNFVRVFLNDLVWHDDPKGLEERIDKFLECADKYNIAVSFTFFTNGGKNDGKLGKQPEPNNTHNSGWKKTPSLEILADTSKWDYMKQYVQSISKRYANDRRVVLWDIYNEPGNIKSEHIVGGAKSLTEDDVKRLKQCALKLVKESAEWARECNPLQPITFGVYEPDSSPHGKMFNKTQYEESDVISYHTYSPLRTHINLVKEMRKYDRPIMCLEWMARHLGSTFNPILKYLKEERIWSCSFGLVAGKMQTWIPWPRIAKDTPNSNIWFHDIFKPDGTPWDPTEVEYIKNVLKSE